MANDCTIEFRGITWCVPFNDPSNDDRINLQKELRKKNNIDFSFYERKTFCKNVPYTINFLFDIGVETSLEIPQYICLTFRNNNANEQLMILLLLMRWLLLNVFERLVV